MEDKINLLWFSEQLNLSTGYSTVSREVLERWVQLGHNVAAVGWYPVGNPYPHMKLVDGKWKFTGIMQYPGENHIGCGRKLDGKTTTAEIHIRDLKPDVVCSLVDIWFTDHLSRATNMYQKPYINYFPVDADPFPREWIRQTYISDTPLAMSKYGQYHIEKMYKEVFNEKRKIDYLYHGINPDDFYRITDKDELAELEKMKKINGWENKFIVGFVGKHMSRKMIPRLMEAFAKFHKQRPDSVLIMNVGNPKMSDYGGDLERDSKEFGIGDACFTVGNIASHNTGIPTKALNQLYNIFDVHASATSGEGFGMTTAEAMACGTPNIINNYTTSEELVKGRGWLVDPICYVPGQYGVRRAVVDTDKMAEAMLEAYDDEEKRLKLGEAAEKWTNKNLLWDDIAIKFEDICQRAIDDYDPKAAPERIKKVKEFLQNPK
jgi:glycosyltransferase involved in cell wall biosynthesis